MMDVRTALILNSPSLNLQRAAGEEIARLDASLKAERATNLELSNTIATLREQVSKLEEEKSGHPETELDPQPTINEQQTAVL